MASTLPLDDKIGATAIAEIDDAALLATARNAFGFLWASSTSSEVMRPSGPLPTTVSISIPSSLATRRALGEVNKRPSRRGKVATFDAIGADEATGADDIDVDVAAAAAGALTFATGGVSPSANKYPINAPHGYVSP